MKSIPPGPARLWYVYFNLYVPTCWRWSPVTSCWTWPVLNTPCPVGGGCGGGDPNCLPVQREQEAILCAWTVSQSPQEVVVLCVWTVDHTHQDVVPIPLVSPSLIAPAFSRIPHHSPFPNPINAFRSICILPLPNPPFIHTLSISPFHFTIRYNGYTMRCLQ